MPITQFTVLVDTVQQRISQDGLSTLVGAQDWDIAASSNTFLDGVSGTMFLLPAAYDSANWLNSNTGIYQKLPPTDFTITLGSGTVQANPAPNPDNAPFVQWSNNSGSSAITSYSVAVNQALGVEFYIPPGTAAGALLGSAGWGASGDYTTGVSLNFYSNGQCDIYQAGAFLYTLTASGQNSDYGETDNQIPSQTQGQYIMFLLIPCRQRELLVLCSNGGGFSCIFASIPEGNPGGLPITPSAPIWFVAPSGVDATWRMSLCQYASSGNAIGKQSFWRYDPGSSPTGGFQGWINGDTSGGTLAGAFGGSGWGNPCGDGVTPSSPYANNTNGVALNVAMTGSTQTSGGYTVTTTPFLYGVRGYTLPVLSQTWGTNPLNVTEYVLEFTYEASDSVAGTRAHMVLKDPKAIIAAGYAFDSTNQPGFGIQWCTGRSWQVYDSSGTQILEGMNLPPLLEEGIVYDSSGNPTYGSSTNANERVIIELRDLWLLAENFIFKDQYPLDGMTLLQALTLITDACGITDSTNQLGHGARTWNMSSSIASYPLPQAGSVTNSDYNLLIESGDKASDKIDEIFKRYAGNCFIAMVPSNGWCRPTLLTEADLPSSPSVTLYDCEATATALSVSTTYLDWFRKLDVQMVKPEANDIYVQGWDYRQKRPILCHQYNSANANPATIPANRTPAWVGERESYAWNDPSLSTIGATVYAEGLLYDRLTIARALVEVECDYRVTLPRGNLLKLYFASGGGIADPATGNLDNPVQGRIKTISSRFIQTSNDELGARWLPTKYTMQVGTDASIMNTMHTDVRSIWMQYLARTVSKYSQLGDANDKPIWRRPLLLQDEA